MDKQAVNSLHLQPKSDEELHAALRSFEMKWQRKSMRLSDIDSRDSRISR